MVIIHSGKYIYLQNLKKSVRKMIVTILLLIKKFLELARKHNLTYHSFNFDLIRSSIYTSDSLNESSVVFVNCNTISLYGVRNNGEIECFETEPYNLKKHKRLQSKRQMLNTIKKMEFEEDGNKDLLNGILAGFKGNLTSPVSDCNSNNLPLPKENLFLCSTDSIHDCPDFLQDNSEYQWCLDYGYKYNNFHQQSILSLSRSQDLIYYDDMARNIDANLAEVDMEDFNREDIHSVLSSIPNIQGVEEREMFASVTGSMMVKFDFDSCVSPRSNSQEEQISTSVCKSQILFSPVRENYLPNSSLSVDSLELSENDINLMVTCQSNKNNYTIAFEGSTVMTSDDSETRETYTSGCSRSEGNRSQNQELSDNEHIKSDSRIAMVTSDSPLTTWTKIKENPSEILHLKRHPSENNNTTIDAYNISNRDLNINSFKSLSLPNLFRPKQNIQNSGLSLSVKFESETKRKSLSNDYRCVKLYDIQSNCTISNQSTSSASKNPAHNLNLVKLFIKQKSASNEGILIYTTEEISNDDNIKNTKNFQNIEKNRGSNKITELNNIITDNCLLKHVEDTSLTKNVKNEEIVETKVVCSKPTKQNAVNSKNENFVSKHITSDHNEKKIYHNGYYSDESTQENGSNTESAEILTCSCSSSPVIGKKKLLTEKCIQTSKVLDINDTNEDTQKKPLKVPVYILYPNYSLPNLEFLRKEHYIQNIDFSKVFLRPQKFRMPESPVATPKKVLKPQGKRPFSVNDIETLKKTGFKHVKDWESLTFLLPKEYKQFLQEIPEIVSQLKDVKNSKEEVVPLFYLSPPPNRKIGKRPNSCDINFSNDSRNSNFSSTTTQPSSGFRGSSTMLISNNSCNTNSPRNPSFNYKYEINSESGSSRKSGSVSHNKNCSVNMDNSNESLPQRPPLPKSILRNNLDNHQYSCKTQKEYANKRYSNVELSDKNLIVEKCHNKRSLKHSNSKSPQDFNRVFNEKNQLVVDIKSGFNESLRNAECHENKSTLENDMRRLEELLEISAVFGESIESFTENDMIRLRSQVSKFLAMQKNLEKVSETLQTVDEKKADEFDRNRTAGAYEDAHSLTIKNLQTPHNTPEHKKQPNNNHILDANTVMIEHHSKSCNCNGRIHEFERNCKLMNENIDLNVGLRKTVSFAEKISFAVKEHELLKEKNSSNVTVIGQKNDQAKVKRPVNLPICEESVEVMFNDFPTNNLLENSADLFHKRGFILDVENAVKKVIKLCKEGKEDPANICLHHLCPSLYAILSDGLKEEIETPFGPIRNSVWSVVEASSQQGPMTQTLNELVQRLNRDDIFTEGLIKFNAFIFGLLNAKALSGWFTYLRTRDSLLRKYYDNSSLLWLSNTAGAPVRVLVDQLISIIEPLCSLQFNLDLMYQTKLLHCSLQNLNSLLEEPNNNDFLTPTKQFMLLKLVQSIQSSLSQSGEGKKSKHVLENIEQKTSDPPIGHLLMENKNVRVRRGGNKTRPRSGCDSVVTNQEVSDVASAIKKRWSGVNLSSKLVEAFDRLVNEPETDYSDNLDIAAGRQERVITVSAQNIQKEKSTNVLTKDLEADTDTKKQKKNILLNLNKKSGSKIEDCQIGFKEKGIFNDSTSKIQNGGQKFKRLQQKSERWEKNGRSPSDSDSDTQSLPFEKTPLFKRKSLNFKSQKSEKPNCDNNTVPSPTSKISKIPRLVTSPLSSTPSIKLTGNSQKLVSPTGDLSQKARKINNSSRGSTFEEKAVLAGGNRISRADEKSEFVVKTDFGKNQAASTTNYSHRRFNSAPVKKSEPVSNRIPTMSLSRKPALKKLHQAPRTVRTLTHRLPSDSGHLSFNAGEKLKVVLEVDKVWLLCCRGSQKGLVPKSLVISDIDDKF